MLDKFKKKASPNLLHLTLTILLLSITFINLYLYYRSFNADRFRQATSSTFLIVLGVCYHVLPLGALFFITGSKKVVWILTGIFACNRTIIDLEAFIFRPTTNQFLSYHTCFFLITVCIIFLLESSFIRNQFKITRINQLFTLALGIALPCFLLFYFRT